MLYKALLFLLQFVALLSETCRATALPDPQTCCRNFMGCCYRPPPPPRRTTVTDYIDLAVPARTLRDGSTDGNRIAYSWGPGPTDGSVRITIRRGPAWPQNRNNLEGTIRPTYSGAAPHGFDEDNSAVLLDLPTVLAEYRLSQQGTHNPPVPRGSMRLTLVYSYDTT